MHAISTFANHRQCAPPANPTCSTPLLGQIRGMLRRNVIESVLGTDMKQVRKEF